MAEPRVRRRIGLRQLTALFLLLFLLATVATGVATYTITRSTIAQLVDRRIDTISDVVADDEHGPVTLELALHRIAVLGDHRDTGDIGFELERWDGSRLGGNVVLRNPLPLGYSTLRSRDGISGLSAGRAYVRMIAPDLKLTTVAETEPFDDYANARVRIYVLGFGSIVVIVLGGVAAFGVLVARRIAETRRTVDAIIDGDLARRVPVGNDRDEFDRQAAAFNRMLDRIGDLMEGLRNVSNDVAHDLRTPLARLRSQLALTAGRADSPALRDEIAAAIAQCDQLLGMFTAVLRITEIEAGRRQAGFAAFDLGVLASEVAEMMQPVAADADHVLTLAPIPRIPIVGDRQLLTQALVNLIENALRHTPPGSTITVTGSVQRDTATITVGDDGPGIPADQRATALRRFGRLDKSRSRAGHGLGLPMVASIARLHRGEVRLADASPGLAVSITIPVGG